MAPQTENFEGLEFVLDQSKEMLDFVGAEVRVGGKSLAEMAIDVPEVLKVLSFTVKHTQHPGNAVPKLDPPGTF